MSIPELLSHPRVHAYTRNFVDALGKLDGKGCLLEWKTTSSRYAEEPDGLLALDPQLVSFSWITGISDVAGAVVVWWSKGDPRSCTCNQTVTSANCFRESTGPDLWSLEETVGV